VQSGDGGTRLAMILSMAERCSGHRVSQYCWMPECNGSLWSSTPTTYLMMVGNWGWWSGSP